jgi:hypothetical protein
MPQPVVLAIFAFFLGCFSTYYFAIFNLRNAELTDRINDLYKDLEKVSDKATEYWLMEGTDEGIPLLEAQIIGLQHRILNMVEQLTETWWTILPSMQDDLDILTDALTGGNFQVKDRNPEFERALSCQIAASTIMNQLRKIRRSFIKLI